MTNAPHSFGNLYNITLFGESHGPGIGIVIQGLPTGIRIDLKKVAYELSRRKPGQSKISTPRDEKDQFEVLSGLTEGITSGGPLTFLIRNTDTRSKDYSLFRKIHRPSQVDYPALLRYGRDVDLRGSGMFSGRLTAPIVIAGSIAKQLLDDSGVKVGAYVSQIGNIKDIGYYSCSKIQENVEKSIVRAVDQKIASKMISLIEGVKKEKDSIGGVVSICVEGYPAGIGNPMFHSLESDLAAGIMSIPACRGIEFGTGFHAAEMKGSVHNDSYILKGEKIETRTNHCGGIIGGISIGAPILIRVPIKPTGSIGATQSTLDFSTKKMVDLNIEGRHDPCIVPRALIALESIVSIVLYDHYLQSKLYLK